LEKCKEAANQAAAKEAQVEKLEEQVHQLELKLNLKWKEAQEMSDSLPPPAVFGDQLGRSPRTEEMAKVIPLVTSDREE
jgi:hypothetical protein